VYRRINTVIIKEPVMAKIHEEVIVITVSKLVKDSDAVDAPDLANTEIIAALGSVAEELFGNGVVVEVNKA
jgi:hypothetical protein